MKCFFQVEISILVDPKQISVVSKDTFFLASLFPVGQQKLPGEKCGGGHFRVLDTMYQYSMMKNIHSPNLLRIGSWGSEIWPREYLTSPIEISVNWPGSKQL